MLASSSPQRCAASTYVSNAPRRARRRLSWRARPRSLGGGPCAVTMSRRHRTCDAWGAGGLAARYST